MNKDTFMSYIAAFERAAAMLEDELQADYVNKGQNAKLTGAEFEEMVGKALVKVGIDSECISHSPQKFPDFILTDKETGEKIGLEVKKTDEKKWEIIGGSIYESLRNDIEETFIMMAKMGGEKPEVKLRRYEACLADLRVTHSPRFYLNLDLEPGQDYLSRHNATDLLGLEGESLNKKIRQLLRTNKSTWWSEGETTPYSSLPLQEKNAYLNDGIALFPEVFGGNYDNFTPWMIYSCLVWCGNIRDIFSAGGNKEIEAGDIFVSAIMYRCFENAQNVKDRIKRMSEEEIAKFWKRDPATITDRIEAWIEIVKDKIKLSKEVIIHNRTKLRYVGKADDEISQDVVDVFFDLWRDM